MRDWKRARAFCARSTRRRATPAPRDRCFELSLDRSAYLSARSSESTVGRLPGAVDARPGGWLDLQSGRCDSLRAPDADAISPLGQKAQGILDVANVTQSPHLLSLEKLQDRAQGNPIGVVFVVVTAVRAESSGGDQLRLDLHQLVT